MKILFINGSPNKKKETRLHWRKRFWQGKSMKP